MDLSKLPKLSDSTPPAAAQAAANSPDAPSLPTGAGARPPVDYAAPPPPSATAENWFCIVLGVILILWGRNFIAYAIARLTGKEYHTGVVFTSSGAEVPYPELQGFVMYTESGLVLFGLALLFDAFARMTGKRPVVGVAFLMSLLATAYNAFVASKFFTTTDAGLPIISLLAVAFGGYMAISQWKWLQFSARRSA